MRRHLALACVLAMSGGSAHAAVGVWTEVRENPFLLDHQALAVDGVRQILYAFGGAGPDPMSGALYSQDLSQPFIDWTLESAGIGPGARTLAHAFFDERRDRLIILGGEPANDAWAWDPQAHTWSAFPVATRPPFPLTSRTPLVWDRREDRLLYVDGQGGAVPCLVWALSLVAPDSGWALVPTTGAPPVLHGAAAACDSTTNRVFVLGGGDASSAAVDLWQLDLATGQWSILLGAGPLGTISPWLGIDPVRRMLVARGGMAPPGIQPATRAADVPLDSAASWIARSTVGEPGDVDRYRGTYDAHARRFVGTAYDAGNARLARLSTESFSWTERWRRDRPVSFDHAAHAIDPSGRWWYVHGGSNHEACPAPPTACNSPHLRRVSLDDPGQYETLAPLGPGPGGLRGHAAVFDSVGRRILVHGGLDDAGVARSETWVLELGPPLRWTLLPTQGASPARFLHGFALDVERRFAYVVGGSGTPNVLRLDLTTVPATWSELATGIPAGAAAAGFDPATNRLVVTTEGGGTNDAGSGYTIELGSMPPVLSTPVSLGLPTGRGYAWDALGGRMLLHNGYFVSAHSGVIESYGLREFDGSALTTVLSDVGTTPVAIAASVYDPISSRLIGLNGLGVTFWYPFRNLRPVYGQWEVELQRRSRNVEVELVGATRDTFRVRLLFQVSSMVTLGVERWTDEAPFFNPIGYAVAQSWSEYSFVDPNPPVTEVRYRGWWQDDEGLHYTDVAAIPPTPTRLDLVGVVAGAGGVRVTFSGEGDVVGGLTVQRTPAHLEEWSTIGAATEGTPGTWTYVDAAAPAGVALRYRGLWRDKEGMERVTSPSAPVIRSPAVGEATLSLRARDGAVGHGWPVALECRLVSAEPARLELLDVTGRIVARHTVRGAPGAMVEVALAPERATAGVWFARLRQAGAVVVARFVRL